MAEDIPLRQRQMCGGFHVYSYDPETGQGAPFPVYMYELFMPEVEVDMETGKARVVKFTTVADVGNITTKTVVDGQIYGGLAQGIGLALTEDFEDLKAYQPSVLWFTLYCRYS